MYCRYGFVIALVEYEKTIPTLWTTAQRFLRDNPQFIAKDNALQFISAPPNVRDFSQPRVKYNMCHFWSNMEIGSLDFFRSEAYLAYRGISFPPSLSSLSLSLTLAQRFVKSCLSHFHSLFSLSLLLL
jgi:hypothetical protein